MQASTESAERRIFHQDKFSGPRGPNVVLKTLVRRRRQHIRRQKPTSKCLITDAHSAQVASFRTFAVASGPHQLLTAFLYLKTMFLLLLKPSKIIIYSSPRKALSGDSTASHLHGDNGSANPCRWINTTAWTAAHRFSLIFPLRAPNGNGGGSAKNSPCLTAPLCIYLFKWVYEKTLLFPSRYDMSTWIHIVIPKLTIWFGAFILV